MKIIKVKTCSECPYYHFISATMAFNLKDTGHVCYFIDGVLEKYEDFDVNRDIHKKCRLENYEEAN